MKRRILKLSITFLICFAITSCFFVYASQKESIKNINSSIVRFHIKANSNTDSDQKIKMAVRDYFFKAADLNENMDKEKTLEYFRENEKLFEIKINSFLREKGTEYTCDIDVGAEYFPIKEYEGFTLPSGIYDAVIVRLGKAEGNNFFCVMYPSLCILDGISQKTEDNMKMFYSVLDESETELIADSSSETVVKFKIVEIIDKILKKTD